MTSWVKEEEEKGRQGGGERTERRTDRFVYYACKYDIDRKSVV